MLKRRLGVAFAMAVAGLGVVTAPSASAATSCSQKVSYDANGQVTYRGVVCVSLPGGVTGEPGATSVRAPRAGSERSRPPCQYRLYGTDLGDAATGGLGRTDGSYYFKSCPGVPVQLIFVPDGVSPAAGDPGATVVIDPRVIAADLLAELTVPLPAPGVNPELPVVDLATWLWVGEESRSSITRSRSVLGVTATLRAELRSVRWDLGDGQAPVICDGPGSPWRAGAAEGSSDCTWTFRRSSAAQPVGGSGLPEFAGQVSASWQVSWSSSTGGSGSFDDVSRSQSFGVPVAEVQSVVQEAR